MSRDTISILYFGVPMKVPSFKLYIIIIMNGHQGIKRERCQHSTCQNTKCKNTPMWPILFKCERLETVLLLAGFEFVLKLSG